MTALLALALAAPTLGTAPPGQSLHPDDVAVVIGIESYYALPRAPGAVRDAESVQDYLRRTRGLPDERITVLAEAPNREAILEAAKAAGDKAGPGHTAWLFFAGHGVSTDGTDLLLLGVDAQPKALATRAVSVAELAQDLAAGGARPVLWIDAGFGPTGRGDEALHDGTLPRLVIPDVAPAGGVLWLSGPTDGLQPMVDGHGAFTWMSVGALHGWGDRDDDGKVTTAEANAWTLATADALEVPEPVLVGAVDDEVWADGVDATPVEVSVNDVRRPDTVLDDGSGPNDVAEEADGILKDARSSLRTMAKGLGGDIGEETEAVTVGRVSGSAEDAPLAEALAAHLDDQLPPIVTAVRFTSFSSKPPLSARVVTVNFEVEIDGRVESFLVEKIPLLNPPSWALAAEQIGRRLKDQLAELSGAPD